MPAEPRRNHLDESDWYSEVSPVWQTASPRTYLVDQTRSARSVNACHPHNRCREWASQEQLFSFQQPSSGKSRGKVSEVSSTHSPPVCAYTAVLEVKKIRWSWLARFKQMIQEILNSCHIDRMIGSIICAFGSRSIEDEIECGGINVKLLGSQRSAFSG